MKKYRIYRKLKDEVITLKICICKDEAIKELAVYRSMGSKVFIEVSI